MADILIKGLCLSKDWEMISINIRRDGKVSRSFDLNGEKIAEAIINPPSGHWINIYGDSNSMRQCSECLQEFDYIDGICYLVSGQELPPYCPNCGARMVGEQDERS